MCEFAHGGVHRSVWACVCDMSELVAPPTCGAGSSAVYRPRGVDEDKAWGGVQKGKCEHMCSADKCATSSCLGFCVLPKCIMGISAWVWLDGWVCVSRSFRTTLWVSKCVIVL